MQMKLLAQILHSILQQLAKPSALVLVIFTVLTGKRHLAVSTNSR